MLESFDREAPPAVSDDVLMKLRKARSRHKPERQERYCCKEPGRVGRQASR
jgi:hypothetical protein